MLLSKQPFLAVVTALAVALSTNLSLAKPGGGGGGRSGGGGGGGGGMSRGGGGGGGMSRGGGGSGMSRGSSGMSRSSGGGGRSSGFSGGPSRGSSGGRSSSGFSGGGRSVGPSGGVSRGSASSGRPSGGAPRLGPSGNGASSGRGGVANSGRSGDFSRGSSGRPSTGRPSGGLGSSEQGSRQLGGPSRSGDFNRGSSGLSNSGRDGATRRLDSPGRGPGSNAGAISGSGRGPNAGSGFDRSGQNRSGGNWTANNRPGDNWSGGNRPGSRHLSGGPNNIHFSHGDRNHNHGNWNNSHNNWGHNNHGNWGRGNRGWYGNRNYFGFAPYWYPYWGVGLGAFPYRTGFGAYPFGYYGGYGFGYAGYGGYGNSYSTNYVYADDAQQQIQPELEVAQVEQQPLAATDDTQEAADQYYSAAYDAFQRGDYATALRQASHAAVEAPNHPKIHELISLILFAQGEYRPAAMEAHAAAALGPVSDWPTLYAYYGNVDTYRGQLDKLVKFQKANPELAEGQFLLGYHNLMMGHKEVARTQLERALAKVPQDEVARNLVIQLGGKPAPAPTDDKIAPPSADPEPAPQGAAPPPVNPTPEENNADDPESAPPPQ